MQTYTEFPTILKQAKSIAYVYKLIGLYSIPLLTLVTIVSMSNVFTAGLFASNPLIQITWAIVFAVAIDVNIVRMFVEGYLHKSIMAYLIGGGLGLVTGAALLIEGLQQSIGLSWQNANVQITITVLIGFRVLFVIILMAREGIKLGGLVHLALQSEPQHAPQNATFEEDEQPYEESPQATLEPLEQNTEQHFPEPEKISSLVPVDAMQEDTVEHEKENTDDGPDTDEMVLSETKTTQPLENTKEAKSVNRPSVRRGVVASKKEKIFKYLRKNPNASITDIMRYASVTKSYASTIRSEFLNEQKVA